MDAYAGIEGDPLDAFAKYLRQLGFKVSDRRDPFDALVYRVGAYHEFARRDTDGKIHLTEEAELHWQQFAETVGLNWHLRVRAHYDVCNDLSLRAMLIHRDGLACCVCGQPMPDDDITLEHWLPTSRGGNNQLHNLALAHGRCNFFVGSLSIQRKLRIRDYLRRLVGEAGGLDVNTLRRHQVWEAAGVLDGLEQRAISKQRGASP
jgi:hypothetical protein